MHFTRRQFVIGSIVGLGAMASPAFARLNATTGDTISGINMNPATWILNRIGYGATPDEQALLRRLGLQQYLNAQLHPDESADILCNERLANATLHIEYKEAEAIPAKSADSNGGKAEDAQAGYPAVNEDRKLTLLHSSIDKLWDLTDNKIRMDGKERSRPVQELRAATWIRAVYSKWQLREVMVEFWHNHFNVNALSDSHIAVGMPAYDAIMRQHVFGNFREFLEAIAKSTAMLYYLNNAKSKEGPANENYARELFELHTLGADHYYNDLYNRWREVPGATKGQPIGYIDQDVYEAARAFTGWTVEDGSNTGKGTIFPKTGKFTYYDGWHDNYQKRVLGTEFDPNSPPMADGNKVLDLVASHPGTAIFLCTKLCRRFVSDNPPKALVAKAADVWKQNLHTSDQIKRVLETIILSPEFAASEGMKVKRPVEFVASFMRATDADLMPNENLFNTISGAGYKQFEWAAPTGHPDVAQYWLNTNTTLSCWNLLPSLMSDGFKAATFDLQGQTPDRVKTSGDIIWYWVERLTGKQPDGELMAALMEYMPHPSNPQFIPDLHSAAFKEPLQQMVMTVAQLPDFQVR